ISNLTITPNDLTINYVNNVATLSGTIFDPGPSDSFVMTVNWGDESAPQVVALPAGATNFVLTHVFDDNRRGDPTQLNPVSISISDVHTGVGTALTAITVRDVNPTLVNFTGSDVGSNGILTITGTIGHPGSSPLTVTINWENSVQVIENMPQGNFTITHYYDAPPDEANPSAPITVTFQVASDTNLAANANHSSAISGLGPVGGQLALFYVQQQTTIPKFDGGGQHLDVVPAQPIALTFNTVQFDLRPPQGQGLANTKAVVALRVFDTENSSERGVVILPVDVLNNLTELFAKLPDDHYRLYYVEQGTERMIMDVVVRHGKPIDPLDESEGTQDRPPTSHLERAADEAQMARDREPAAERGDVVEVQAAPEAAAPVENAEDILRDGAALTPALITAPEIEPEAATVLRDKTPSVATARYRALFAPAVAAVVAGTATRSWAERVDESLAKAEPDALAKSSRWRRRLRRILLDAQNSKPR
ncbi:MAG: hypothetical protein ABUL64_03345, partial [Singulisphaera sp.]